MYLNVWIHVTCSEEGVRESEKEQDSGEASEGALRNECMCLTTWIRVTRREKEMAAK